MKHVLACLKRADRDFGMIRDGDHIAVGLSGGKDSIVLLHALRLYRYYSGLSYGLTAVTLDLGIDGEMNTEPLREYCGNWDIPYHVRKSDIADVVFHIRQEKNPCSLCSKMRRGMLHELCLELGIKKIALGHHREDAIETFMMSMLLEGRISTFSPLSWMDRTDIVQIRPLIYVPEQKIIEVRRKLELPVVKNKCPMDGHSKRQEIKELIQSFRSVADEPEKYMLLALQKTQNYNLWDKIKRRPGE